MTEPTKQQIEALKKIAALRWPPYKDSLLWAIAIAKAALTAAAGVADDPAFYIFKESEAKKIEAAERERCAQRLEEMAMASSNSLAVNALNEAAGTIRARKEPTDPSSAPTSN